MSRILISLSGKLQVGKDTIADYLIKNYNFTKLSFAKNLKKMCQEVFKLEPYHTDTQEGKSEYFNPYINFSNRHFREIIKWMKKTHNVTSNKNKIKILKEKYVNQLFLATPRHILQFVGTEICREICESYHIDIIEEKIVCNKDKNYVIVDARYPNEREMIKKHKGVLVLVQRPSIETKDSHISENSLGIEKDYKFVIKNIGTIEDLEKLTNQLMLDINLIKDRL